VLAQDTILLGDGLLTFPLEHTATSTLQYWLRPCCGTNTDVRISRREIVNKNFGDSINMAYCMRVEYNSSEVCAMLRSIWTRSYEGAKCFQITNEVQSAERK